MALKVLDADRDQVMYGLECEHCAKDTQQFPIVEGYMVMKCVACGKTTKALVTIKEPPFPGAEWWYMVSLED